MHKTPDDLTFTSNFQILMTSICRCALILNTHYLRCCSSDFSSSSSSSLSPLVVVAFVVAVVVVVLPFPIFLPYSYSYSYSYSPHLLQTSPNFPQWIDTKPPPPPPHPPPPPFAASCSCLSLSYFPLNVAK